jgi:hypothetical protein
MSLSPVVSHVRFQWNCHSFEASDQYIKKERHVIWSAVMHGKLLQKAEGQIAQ